MIWTVSRRVSSGLTFGLATVSCFAIKWSAVAAGCLTGAGVGAAAGLVRGAINR
jgi:hypothetical protein